MRLLKEFFGNTLLLLHLLVLFKYVFDKNGVFAESRLKLKGYLKDTEANFTELANSYGYVSEEHTVVTDDGYVICLFRIPKGKNCHGPLRKPPVLLMHGFPQSSDSWLDAGPSSLAFLISDACCDLWIGNVRGNYYGRRHVRLNPNVDAHFWKFSSHEMAIFDLPAIIDLMLKTTDSKNIMYIGYSQGGRILFILCSETDYCNKIKFSISLAPAARMKYTKSLLVQFGFKLFTFLEPYLRSPAVMEAFPRHGTVQKFGSFISKLPFVGKILSEIIMSIIDSFDPGAIAVETYRMLLKHSPEGSSARNIAFFGQGKSSGRFQKYDYGSAKNLELYESVNPPLYNLSRTNIPVVLIYGNRDFIVDPRDVKWLAKQLPNVIENYEVPRFTWNHLDFCYSQFINQTIFHKIKDYLDNFSDNV